VIESRLFAGDVGADRSLLAIPWYGSAAIWTLAAVAFVVVAVQCGPTATNVAAPLVCVSAGATCVLLGRFFDLRLSSGTQEQVGAAVAQPF